MPDRAVIGTQEALPNQPTSLPTVYHAATQSDLRHVSNGTYALRNNASGVTSEYIVRLTTATGQLAPQRILQRMTAGRYTGFATLMADGTVWIWNRYSTERGGAYHRLLNAQFHALAQGSVVRLAANTAMRVNGRQVTLTVPLCNQCNTPVTWLSAYCGGSCQVNMSREFNLAEIPWRTQLHPAAAPRVTRESLPSFTRRPPRPRSVAPRTRTTPARRSPVMSEINPDEIQ